MARFGPLVAPLGEGHVDLAARVVLRSGRALPLTPREADLIGYLAHRNEPVSPNELLREVWGYSAASRSRTVLTTVTRVRKKVEVDPSHPQVLVTEFGGTYRWAPVARREAAPEAELLGRAAELATLDAVDGAFVTLVGEGGIGKTSLARAWIRRHRSVEVSLALAHSLPEVETALAAALRSGRAEPLAAAGAAARARGLRWILLDNLEQLDPDARAALPGLWGAGLRVLGTSRVALGLEGEVVVRVPPLDARGSNELLVARCAHRDLRGDPDLGPLLDALGGRPLDIELAAARMSVCSPAALLRRLARPLDVLSSAKGEGRHASLRGSIRWSWDLLSPAAQADLATLQVFQAPFRLDAAEAVLGRPAREVVDHLVSHSWLRTLPEGHLTFVQAVRQFVGEVSPPPEAALRAHLAWFATFGEPWRRVALDLAVPPPVTGGRAELTRVLPDLLAAARWGLDHDPEAAAHALLAAMEMPAAGHPSGTILPLAERFAGRVSDTTQAEIEASSAFVWRSANRYDRVVVHARRAVALSEGRPEAWLARARALARLCGASMLDGDLTAARGFADEAEAVARASGNEAILTMVLQQRCSLHGYAGEFRLHLAVASELRRSAEAAGDLLATASGWMNQGRCLHQLGEVALAEDAFAQALIGFDRIGSDLGAILVHGDRSSMLRCANRPAEALVAIDLALERARATQRKSFEVFLLVLRADALRRMGELDAARAALAQVQAEPGGIPALAAQERVQAEALRAELEDPPEVALPILVAQEEEARRVRVELAALQIAGRRVRVLVALGRRAEARELAASLTAARLAGEWGPTGNEVAEAEQEAWAALGGS